MAQQVQVGGTAVKIRQPAIVFVLAIVTLGIYYLVWYYKVNRELRDAVGADVNPWLSLLAVTLGGFVVVPPFVSWYRTFQRIEAAQEQAGSSSTVSPALGLVLVLIASFLLPFELIYAQEALNKLWKSR